MQVQACLACTAISKAVTLNSETRSRARFIGMLFNSCRDLGTSIKRHDPTGAPCLVVDECLRSHRRPRLWFEDENEYEDEDDFRSCFTRFPEASVIFPIPDNAG